MEELLSTFVRSIFSDNMIFTYYLGMCSFLAVSKNVKTALGLGIAVTFILTCTLPINYMLENYVLKEGALQWLGPEYAEVNLSASDLHRYHRGFHAIGGDGCREVLAFVVCVIGYLLAFDRRELCHLRRFVVYAATGVPECGCRYDLRTRIGYRLDAGNRRYGGYS